MKKIILITILAISVIKTKAQTTGVPDTLAYLQNIVSNKANYIGQPFSVLQNNLQIHIKYFFPYADLPYDEAKETSTSFSFYFPIWRKCSAGSLVSIQVSRSSTGMSTSNA